MIVKLEYQSKYSHAHHTQLANIQRMQLPTGKSASPSPTATGHMGSILKSSYLSKYIQF